jgi:hypothetical protein
MVSSHGTATAAAAPASRRRGAVLERAILDAALEQLGAVGWKALTMEGVTKEDLVADALRTHLPAVESAPDLGNVRDDLLELCREASEAMFSPAGSAVRAIVHECDAQQAERFYGIIVGRVIDPTIKLLRDVITRGIERKEVRAGAANPYVFDVIPAMMMYRTKVCGCEWSEVDIQEMIDQLMVPLLRPDGK